jgi:hypothetical protein
MNPSPHIPDLKLERFLLGELTDDEAGVIRSAIGRDADVQARLTALEASNAELLQAHPVGPFVAAVDLKLSARNRGRAISRRTWVLAPAALAAAALLFVLRPSPTSDFEWSAANGEQVSGDRFKGDGPQLVVFLKDGADASRLLAQGAYARSGDVVQVAYRGVGENFGVIVSLDGRGHVTRHFPLNGETASRLRSGGLVPLDSAYRLDDAPRAERFFLVTSNDEFEVAGVLEAAGRPGLDPLRDDRLPIGPHLAQASFLLKKD